MTLNKKPKNRVEFESRGRSWTAMEGPEQVSDEGGGVRLYRPVELYSRSSRTGMEQFVGYAWPKEDRDLTGKAKSAGERALNVMKFTPKSKFYRAGTPAAQRLQNEERGTSQLREAMETLLENID